MINNILSATSAGSAVKHAPVLFSRCHRSVIYLDIVNQAGLVSAQGRAGAGAQTASAVMGDALLSLIELSVRNHTNLRDLFEPVLRHKNNIPDIHCPIAFLGRRNVGR